MSFAVGFVKFTNKIFPAVVHPFNLANDKKMTYAEWQFEKGESTIACYKGIFTPEEMFLGKEILDMGCGAAGKSLYYASLGAARVVGVDIVERYEAEATALAEKLGYAEVFKFVRASADALPFPDESFDTVIMNDFMEHISNPEAALKEAMRLLKKDGRIFINFPPYYHPTGAHLSDTIHMPWIHMFLSEKQLIKAYKALVKGLPDEKERLDLRLTTDPDGTERLGYINKMTLKRFKKILAKLEIKPAHYHEIPLRKFLTPLAKLPFTKEMFVKMAVCVIAKQ
ncbi:MAG: class I SAM-dependent methyltransferase [Clostridia bacterium]|nr:class I SAM-dependent methyltransferase [Clostridia bacterium]